MNNVHIYTDGSSLGNPGPGGFCAIIIASSKKIIVKGGAQQTTNNRMEMSAIIAGLYYLHKHFPRVRECTVVSDSNLVIQSIMQSWKRKKNIDLWAKLDHLIEKFDHISWKWVRGHSGHVQNTEADRVAVLEATKQKKAYLRTR